MSQGSDYTPKENEHIPLMRPLLPDLAEFTAILGASWEKGHVSNGGPLERRFETELEQRFGWPNVTMTGNCTMGLQLLCQALELEGEVIAPAFTHPATLQALRWNGLDPVLADVERHWLTLDPAAAQALMTERTTAIIATHIFGYPADVTALTALARRHGLILLFDAAASVGVSYFGRSLATFGHASAFSFHATKIMTTIEGGAVSSPDPAVTQKVRTLRNFGLCSGKSPAKYGTNGKFNDVLAAVGLATLSEVENEIAARASAAQGYGRLGELEGVSIVTGRPGTAPNHAYLPVRLRDREGLPTADRVSEYLARHQVETRRYFGGHYHTTDQGRLPTPVADAAVADVLCLPLWGKIPARHIDRVCDLVEDALRT